MFVHIIRVDILEYLRHRLYRGMKGLEKVHEEPEQEGQL